MFTKKFERRIYIALGAFLLAGVLGTAFGAYVLWPSRREAGYEPAQPITFSHALHAGDLKIECVYCHSQAEKGQHATVPDLSTCMKCHEQVQPKDEDGNLTEAISGLLDHWEQKEPVVWNKVNDLADFVYFDHSRHLAAGVECQECHGPVESMEHMRREYGLKMSWCLSCHRQAPLESDPAFKRGDPTRAPIDCVTCHR
jgi:hypothetical protein